METKKTVSEHLGEIQVGLVVPKSQRNTFGNYNYRSAEDILSAVKPLLSPCTLTLNDEMVLIGARYYVKATATLSFDGDEVTSVAFAREEETKKGMDASQITGSTSSYARKYALNGLFAIDDTKDADSMDNTQVASTPAKTPTTPYKPSGEGTGVSPTPAQIAFLTKNHIDGSGMTKLEASKKIGEIINKSATKPVQKDTSWDNDFPDHEQ